MRFSNYFKVPFVAEVFVEYDNATTSALDRWTEKNGQATTYQIGHLRVIVSQPRTRKVKHNGTQQNSQDGGTTRSY